jgi:hypothetical protein
MAMEMVETSRAHSQTRIQQMSQIPSQHHTHSRIRSRSRQATHNPIHNLNLQIILNLNQILNLYRP